MANFCEVYKDYQGWYWRHHFNMSFEDHVNNMSLHEFMELLTNWDME
jgi:hypothetical protein